MSTERKILDLCVNDRLVRTTLQQCGIKDADMRNSDIGTELIASVDDREAHDRWSEFIANRGFIIRDRDSIERCCSALKETLRCAA